jgi:hypothetical protein
MVELFEPRTYLELRRDFVKMSLYSYKVLLSLFLIIYKKEVIKSLVRIKALCLEVVKLDLFYFTDKTVIKIEEFRQL